MDQITEKKPASAMEAVSMALDAHKGVDNNYRFNAALFSFVLQTGTRGSGRDHEHDGILRFFDEIEPVIVDREMANARIDATAKAVGVTAIAGKWAPVQNAGRRITQLEGLTVPMSYMIPVILKMPHYAVFKKEPRNGGTKYSVEIRIGTPWEGAQIMNAEKTQVFLDLIRYQALKVTTVWANPSTFAPADGGKTKVVFRSNLVFSSMPSDTNPNSRDHFAIETSEDGKGLVLATKHRPSKFANNPGRRPNS